MKDTTNRYDLCKKMMRIMALVMIWFSLCGGLVQRCSFDPESTPTEREPDPPTPQERVKQSVKDAQQSAVQAADNAAECASVTTDQLDAAKAAYKSAIANGTDIKGAREAAKNAAIDAGADPDAATAAMYAAEADACAGLAEQARQDYEDARKRFVYASKKVDQLSKDMSSSDIGSPKPHVDMTDIMGDLDRKANELEGTAQALWDRYGAVGHPNESEHFSAPNDNTDDHYMRYIRELVRNDAKPGTEKLLGPADDGVNKLETWAQRMEEEGHPQAATVRAAANAARAASDRIAAALGEITGLKDAMEQDCHDLNCYQRRVRDIVPVLRNAIEAARQVRSAMQDAMPGLNALLSDRRAERDAASQEMDDFMDKASHYAGLANKAATKASAACGETPPPMPSDTTYNQDIHDSQGTGTSGSGYTPSLPE